MTVGGVLGEAWALYKAHWRHLLPLALGFYVLLSVVTLLLALIFGWVGSIAAIFVSLVGVFWLQGALVEAVADVRDGRADLSVVETFQRVRPRLWTLVAAGLLAAVGIVLGLIVFVVPGLVLLTWWSVVIPVAVLEQSPPVASLGRSRALVRGHGWTVFGVIVCTVLIVIAVLMLVAILLSGADDWLAAYLSNVLGGGLTAPFVALAWTLMYFGLARRGEVRSQIAEPAAP